MQSGAGRKAEECSFYPPIGNVKTQSAREIWFGEVAAQRSKETVACKSLCLFTCLSQKTIKDKARMALTLVRHKVGGRVASDKSSANRRLAS